MERSHPYDISEPSTLDSVLSQLFARKGYGRAQADRNLHECWRQVAGEELAQRTRVLGLRDGILRIGVANPALLNELVSFGKEALLERLNVEHPQIRVRDLKFVRRGSLS